MDAFTARLRHCLPVSHDARRREQRPDWYVEMRCDAMREGKIHHWAEDGVEREDGIGVSFAQSRSNDGGK